MFISFGCGGGHYVIVYHFGFGRHEVRHKNIDPKFVPFTGRFVVLTNYAHSQLNENGHRSIV